MRARQKNGEISMKRLLRPNEVADILGVPITTLYRWRHHQSGPRALKVGKHLRYRPEDVEEFILDRAITSNLETP